MALSLRELLDKQRADREAKEAKEKGGGAVESVPRNIVTSTRTGHDVTPVPVASPIPAHAPQEKPGASHGSGENSTGLPTPQKVPQAPPKRSMFSSLAGVPTNVTQSQTPSPAPSPVPEAQPQEKSPQMVGGPVASANRSGPATPALTDDETENLRRNLAFLAANLDEKEVIGQVLRTTVRQIQQHPELNAIMIDSDFDLIVAAARRSMKFTARKKEDKADAKATKQSKKQELDQWLKDQGIEL